MIGLIVITISLNSCNTFDRIVKRCTINVQDGECYCHDYRLSKAFVGKVGETIIYPIEQCDRLIGVMPSDFDDLYEAILRDLSPDNNVFLESSNE
jgi:hypothetical protein